MERRPDTDRIELNVGGDRLPTDQGTKVTRRICIARIEPESLCQVLSGFPKFRPGLQNQGQEEMMLAIALVGMNGLPKASLGFLEVADPYRSRPKFGWVDLRAFDLRDAIERPPTKPSYLLRLR